MLLKGITIMTIFWRDDINSDGLHKQEIKEYLNCVHPIQNNGFHNIFCQTPTLIIIIMMDDNDRGG